MSGAVMDVETWKVFLAGLLNSFAWHAAFVCLRRRRLESFIKVGNISGLYHYPLKSGRGIELPRALATGVGLSYDGVADRHWMIVDQNGAFLTQRKEPRMVLISVNPKGKCSSEISIEAPGMDPLLLPKHSIVEPTTRKTMKCRIFSHWVNALDCGQPAAEWICKFLNKTGLRLVVASDDLPMAELIDFSEDSEETVLPGDKVAFADFASYLIISQTSADYVNTKLAQPVDVLNYRPNIVVGGCGQPFEEEKWLEVCVGNPHCDSALIFRCLHLCSRCVMTTVDREKGVKDPDMQPLKTLKSIRGVPKNHSPKFGVNATVNRDCDIKIGDPVFALYR